MANQSTSHAGPETLVIIGAGYSGTLAAVNILREAAEGEFEVVLVEQHRRAGRGLAYRIWDDSMLLNVVAGNMSALAEHPMHFVEYCQDIDPALHAGSFVPRRMFGDYLERTLQVAGEESRIPFTRVQGEAVSLRPQQDGKRLLVTLADGRRIGADHVVLALGHLGAQKLRFADALAGSARYVADPWDYAAMDHVPAGRPVLVLGAGHTAIDALFRLTSRDDARKVFLLSRRGLLPKGHRSVPHPPVTAGYPAYLEHLPPTAFAHLRAIRREVKRRRQAGHNWRDVINELRPHTPEIWHRLPTAERRRLLARVGPWWDIHRHRLAPTAYRRLRGMLEASQAEVVAGRVLTMEETADGIRVTVRRRTDGGTQALDVAAVVNCTGPDYDIDRLSASPLVAQLRDEGYLRPDPLHIGVEVDEEYHPIGADGHKVPGVHYVGPMLRARYWEAIAVPELRRHTLQLARHLIARRGR
ncbi:FAD/NAD(P)-binding protein [Thauera sinica]|uniref:FAD/NAD(P)-binding protein n=1 Tax=Thauera sinica TaxID=2665146 RepID=A0ABW1AQR9_9RHOO|nr:FAD/NAD(P)-binding protein [Thauera sp. K11]ATE59532.1 FAD-dependent oxidoreductase [Thauera sp. K11]